MATCHIALQPVENAGFGKMVADEAESPFGMKLLTVKGNNASRFLAAML